MKTKKFEGATEKEALEKVHAELGLSAIVLNITKNQRRGIKNWFKKPTIIVTAAYDEEGIEKDKLLDVAMAAAQAAKDNEPTLTEPDGEHFSLQSNLPNLQSNQPEPSEKTSDIGALLEAIKEAMPAPDEPKTIPQSENTANTANTANEESIIAEQQKKIQELQDALNKQVPKTQMYDPMIKIFYDSLISQGVAAEIVENVLEDANIAVANGQQDINLLVKIVYNKIIAILGEPRTLIGQETGAGYDGSTQVAIFIGPTGVGKTTTIAKLSSILLLNRHKQVGLITADTYRIAAVEQLRTYAEIMGLNLRVIYSGEEIVANIERLQETHDVILVDTAGRSHHNRENIIELQAMLELVPTSANFLVLSATTRQEDILSTISAYESISDFDLIFTKLDEAGSMGVLLNTCYLTNRRVSYVSFGQSVPEDIERIQPDKIAKALLGTGFNSSAWREA
ncbi:MAG: flagellar biosynthesis protein FlhF [Defluviitaleaceae bacterium]|nr:flagellar biosynthesis protein FlhF [Defluviitaleaceae bacterium]